MAVLLRTKECKVVEISRSGYYDGTWLICEQDRFKVRNGLDYCPKVRNRYVFDYECIKLVEANDIGTNM